MYGCRGRNCKCEIWFRRCVFFVLSLLVIGGKEKRKIYVKVKLINGKCGRCEVGEVVWFFWILRM